MEIKEKHTEKAYKEKEQLSCPLLKQGCGGCPMLALPYEEQLRKKQKKIKKLLGNFGKPQPIIGMENPWHYRNKAISTFTYAQGRQVKSGIYVQGTHHVIPVENCLLHHPALDEAVRAVRKAVREFKYPVYDEDRKTGLVRHILVRHSLAEDQILAVLVTSSPVLPGTKAFAKRVRQLCPRITTLVQNINERSTSAVLGYKERILYGKGYIQDTLCGIRFRISGSSFYQINPVQTEILYRTAVEAAGLDKSQTVLDAYCGVGTIGLSAASKAKKVIGVELNKSAVRCAWENARENGIQNAQFLCADATDFIRKMAAKGERADVVFMDPPRAGSTPEFLRAVSSMRPEKIVYVSCNPETQKRDLELLTKDGWQVKLIQGVDMFPHTEGIETVVLLSKLKVDHHIEIELKMDELDLTAAESKATYDEIKAYVLNKYGLKVSQLYIAQIKRKCGIIERKNYNVSKKEDAKVPQCPPEKEAAIMDALKHFQMI